LQHFQVEWRDVWVGAAVTSFLFYLGKLGLGLYIGKGAIGSSYGAAGSILVLLLWGYYSGLIFYFGAEFTKTYADRYGSRKRAKRPKTMENIWLLPKAASPLARMPKLLAALSCRWSRGASTVCFMLAVLFTRWL
jgi:hypothetical protein